MAVPIVFVEGFVDIPKFDSPVLRELLWEFLLVVELSVPRLSVVVFDNLFDKLIEPAIEFADFEKVDEEVVVKT